MAVHLNARLNTRFIPVLFAVAILTSLISSFVHASAEQVLEARSEAQPLQYGIEDLCAAPADAETMARELEEALRDGADPARIDRVPGFSPITVVAAPNAEAEIGAPYTASPEVTDTIQAQPGEAEAR